MKISLLIISAIGLFIISCGQAKQFDSCTDMASDLKYKDFNDLSEVYGQPTKEEQSPDGLEYTVIWKGVGVGGDDVEILFESGSTGTYIYPSTFKGIYNCN